MLDHLSIQCADMAASSARFFDAVLKPLNGGRVMDFGEVVGYGVGGKPTFWVGPLTTGEPNREVHIAFEASVGKRWARSSTPPSPPALRCSTSHASGPNTIPTTTAPSSAIPDGNNVEAVCHRPA